MIETLRIRLVAPVALAAGLVVACVCPSQHPATLSIVVPPSRAESYAVGEGVIKYTPFAGYQGPDQLTYKICDTGGGCDWATVHLTVTL